MLGMSDPICGPLTPNFVDETLDHINYETSVFSRIWKNGERKGGKYLESENMFFCVEDIYNGEGKYIFLRWRRKQRKRGKYLLRRKKKRRGQMRKICGDGKNIFYQGEYFSIYLIFVIFGIHHHTWND